MLKNIVLNKEIDPINSHICRVEGKSDKIENTSTGIYHLNHFNFRDDVNLQETYINEYPEITGVCDTPEQALEKNSTLIMDTDNQYCICYVKIVKSEEPAQGGWRWKKWGKYIGNKNPQHEYLYDEGEEFEVIYWFAIYGVHV